MTDLSSGEIKLMFKRIDEKLDEHTGVHADIMKAIQDLDNKISNNNTWINVAKGAIAVIMVVVLPLLFWTVKEVSTIDRKIADALDQPFKLEPYVEGN